MRLLAFLAALGIILLGGYFLIFQGYPHFLRTTRSQAGAQVMTLISFAAVSFSVFWAVKKLP